MTPSNSSASLRRALRALDEAGIPHAYFKDPAGLGQALQGGPKDYDLLVAPASRARAEAILRDGGLKQAHSFAVPPVPATSDWLGFDTETGALHHLHLHALLPTGKDALRDYALPWADALLEHRRLHPDHQVWVLSDALNLLILLLRTCVEQKFARHDTSPWAPTAQSVARLLELRALASRDEVLTLAGALLGEPFARGMASWLDPSLSGTPAIHELMRLRPLVLNALKPYRRFHPAGAQARRRTRQLKLLAGAAARKTPLPLPPRRRGLRLPHKGLIIAVIGPDGAGKSTLTEALNAWLSQLIDTRQLYLGKGDPVSAAWQSLARAKWWALETFTHRQRPPAPEVPAPSPGGELDTPELPDLDPDQVLRYTPPPERSAGRQLMRDMAWVSLAGRHLFNTRRAAFAATRGALVVADRFPFQASHLASGPSIPSDPEQPLNRRVFALAEDALFKSLQNTPPDLILRLNISPEIAWRRKPDHDIVDIASKALALQSIDPGSATLIDLDATLPPEVLLNQAKAAIWEAL
ncbi:hypothetical protein FRC96_04135 [Lujinxingia vulgaris]|uniref:Thymidylate kinase n=1 Tax=Lujinxingia vulgaris TaxID=2600176 RepID=A0A5C6XKP6_9DELT|nr:hypothetical protein [Lujinxingia vulgaris]TXD41661.1 hypothetical protein FRC96_04135 [Lujinxingia vulgaris]